MWWTVWTCAHWFITAGTERDGKRLPLCLAWSFGGDEEPDGCIIPKSPKRTGNGARKFRARIYAISSNAYIKPALLSKRLEWLYGCVSSIKTVDSVRFSAYYPSSNSKRSSV